MSYVPLHKNEVFINDFSSKYDQIRRKLRIWSHLLRKSLMENFIFCAMVCSIYVLRSGEIDTVGAQWEKPSNSSIC